MVDKNNQTLHGKQVEAIEKGIIQIMMVLIENMDRLNMDSIFHAHKLWKNKRNVTCMQRLWNKLQYKQKDINRKFNN